VRRRRRFCGGVPEQIAGPGTKGRRHVLRVVQGAAAQREAATADARVELIAQPLEERDLFVETGPPPSRQPSPVRCGRRSAVGQTVQFPTDLLQAEPDLLRRADEGDPTQHIALEAALAPGRAGRTDETLGLVVAQRRRGDPRTIGHFTDRQVARCHVLQHSP